VDLGIQRLALAAVELAGPDAASDGIGEGGA